MTKISLELDEGLNKRLKQYALDHYAISHGKQQQIIRDALVAFLDTNEGSISLHRTRTVKEPEIVEVEPEQEEVIEICEPEPAPKPRKVKTRKAKEQKRKHVPITESDKGYIKDYFKTHRIADAKWTKIGEGMNPVRSASTVKSTVDRMLKSGELKEEGGSETFNMGE